MTSPLTPDEILHAFRTWRVPFVEEPGWRARSTKRSWGDITGVMCHHTGDDAADKIDVAVIRDGHGTLPGPLSQFALRDDGVTVIIAAGTANHAGGGDFRVLDAVRAENYGAYPPAPRYTHGDLINGKEGSVNGNPLFYGIEACYYRNLTKEARAAYPRLCAALIWALDKKDTANRWTAKSVIGHKEWQRGKVDPALVDMAIMRSEVQALLEIGPVRIDAEMKLSDKLTLTLTDRHGRQKTETLPISGWLIRGAYAYEHLGWEGTGIDSRFDNVEKRLGDLENNGAN